MLADIVDHVIGIDPDRDRITASLVEASTGGELATEAFETTRGGYERLVAWADRHTSRESRAWAVEGSGSYGSGACAHLGAAGEQVIEFSHPRTAATSDGAKTDALDARRAAREVLGRQDLAVPRARGRREALRALETTRHPPRRPDGAHRGDQRTQSPHRQRARGPARPAPRPAAPPPPRSPNAPRSVCRRLPSTSSQPPNRPCAASRGGSRPSPRRPPSSKNPPNEHPRARRSRRPPPARPARRRTRHRRADLHRLVTPRPLPQRSSQLRPPRRRRHQTLRQAPRQPSVELGVLLEPSAVAAAAHEPPPHPHQRRAPPRHLKVAHRALAGVVHPVALEPAVRATRTPQHPPPPQPPRRPPTQPSGDLHTIAVTRSRYCPHTQAYIAKRTAEGKTPREAQRCLKRYIARQIYRLLQHPKINT